MIAGERLGHLDQVALAAEQPAIDVRVLTGIELRIHHDRAEGRLPFLEPGQERSTRIVIRAEEMR